MEKDSKNVLCGLFLHIINDQGIECDVKRLIKNNLNLNRLEHKKKINENDKRIKFYEKAKSKVKSKNKMFVSVIDNEINQISESNKASMYKIEVLDFCLSLCNDFNYDVVIFQFFTGAPPWAK